MGVFEMVVAVVAISVTAGLLRVWIKSRAPADGGALTAEQQQRLVRLEERVKALESVVGDASYELKQKFKDLERTA
ncbi:MAG: hypothetical protein ACRES8_01775 [Nevskiaceae bacterium]